MPAGEPKQGKLAGISLQEVLDSRLLDPLQDFVKLTGLACGSSNVMIHLLDESLLKIIAVTQDGTTDLSRHMCLCSDAVGEDGVLIPDLQKDPRFIDHTLVTSDPEVRFYAAFPLLTNDGWIGSLCIRDAEPRQLSPEQEGMLGLFARQIVDQIVTRRQVTQLNRALEVTNSKVRQLTASDARFRKFLDVSPVSVFIKDDESRMIYCNKALADRFGASPEDWIGKTDYETWPIDVADEFRRSDWQALEADREIHFEDRTRGPDGRNVVWNVYKYPFVDEEERRSVACMALDVTKAWEAQQEVQHIQQELRGANERLRVLSLTDALTGLMNRRALEDVLEIECARAIRSRAPLSVLMLDLDNFKSFNDLFGHVLGDDLLRRVSLLMQRNIRKGDLAARYGGEEFIVILPDTDQEEASQVAERVRQAIAEADWEYRRVTTSGGVATWSDLMSTATDFIQRADEALYAAKRGGKNCIRKAGNADSNPHS